MDKQMVFHILEIEETKDEAVIAQAYRNKLRVTNPEDNPEGFKQLREAYEEALNLARISEKSDKTAADVPQTEVDIWIGKVEQLYEDLFKRCELRRWEELLEEPLCDGLDTALEVREKMLVFLMKNPNIPQEVWKAVDNKFEYVKNIENLSERFPKNFLNYVKYCVENGAFLDFTLFSVREGTLERGNADQYINELLAAKNLIECGEYDKAEEKLETLKAYGYFHPYEQVENIRILLHREKTDEAYQDAVCLRDSYPENDYILFWYANVIAACGRRHEAYELWLSIVERNPEHYSAKMRIAQYLMETGDYYHAREGVLDLLEIVNGDETLEEMLHKANQEMIQVYKEEMRTGAADERFPKEELIFKLGWCLLQEERMQEAADLFDGYTPDDEWEYDYCYLYGRILNQLERYEESLPVLKRCVEIVEHLEDDGSEEVRKRLSRKYIVKSIIGISLHKLGREDEAEQVYRENIAELTGIKEKTETLYNFSRVLLEAERYEKAVDICDTMIGINDQFYPAYLVRQEAYFKLRRGQEVVDDYHNAVNIYAGYSQPYKYALEVFVLYDQYEDAKNVIDLAKKNGVQFTDSMKLGEIKVRAYFTKDRKELLELIKMTEALRKSIKDRDCDIEDKSEIEFELALLYWDNGALNAALEQMEKAIGKNPERLQYRYVRGNLYLARVKKDSRNKDDYKRAFDEYEKAMPAYAYPDNSYPLYGKAECLEGMGRMDEAVALYEEIIRNKGAFRNACEKAADYYDKLYYKTHDRKYFDRCIELMNIQIEAEPRCYYYVRRGLKYMYNMDLDLAIRDFELAISDVPNDWEAWSNKGCCYKYRQEFEEAIICFKKAIECLEKCGTQPLACNDADCYKNLGDCYKRMDRYENAIECYENAVKAITNSSRPNSERVLLWEELAGCYMELEDYSEAKRCFYRALNTEKYYSDMGELYLRQMKKMKGLNFYIKGIKAAGKTPEAKMLEKKRRLELVQVCMDWLVDYKKAIRQLNVLQKLNLADEEEQFDIQRYYAECFYMLGDKKKAQKHAESALEYFAKSNQGSLEDYIKFQPYQPIRLGKIAWLWLCLGEEERAKEAFEKMEQLQCCRDCVSKKCFESSLFLGKFYLAKRDKKKALDYFKEALRRNPRSFDAKCIFTKYL